MKLEHQLFLIDTKNSESALKEYVLHVAVPIYRLFHLWQLDKVRLTFFNGFPFGVLSPPDISAVVLFMWCMYTVWVYVKIKTDSFILLYIYM